MKLLDPYPVVPWTKPCRGELRLPGSKSLTNRSLLLAAMSDGTVTLEEALFSRDTHILIECLKNLGFQVLADPDHRRIEVVGRSGDIPNASASLFVGNAGTVARFLTAFCCLHPQGCYDLDGDEEMRRRPMKGLIQSLIVLGARFTFSGEEFCFPFRVETHSLPGGSWHIDASSSSQMLSALMMVAPQAADDVRLDASGARPAFVAMTAALMQKFGAVISGNPESGYNIPGGQRYRPANRFYRVEPDATAASYFMVLPSVVGGSLRILGLHDRLIQGDLAFVDVMCKLGMRVETDPEGWTFDFPDPPDVSRRGFSFETFSDTFLTLGAIAPLFPCPIAIEDIGHTRFQETDRIAAMARGLRKVGTTVEEGRDFLRIEPWRPSSPGLRTPVLVETFKDHRVAMSFAVLGCRNRFASPVPWLHVEDPGCCGKTFPGFFDQLESLYQYCHDK